MDPYEERTADEVLHSRDFRISKQRIFWVSLITGFYCCFATWLIFAVSRYWLIGDASGFELRSISYAVVVWIAHVGVSCFTMMQLDGMLGSGSEWVTKRVTVKLPETRSHRRFG